MAEQNPWEVIHEDAGVRLEVNRFDTNIKFRWVVGGMQGEPFAPSENLLAKREELLAKYGKED